METQIIFQNTTKLHSVFYIFMKSPWIGYRFQFMQYFFSKKKYKHRLGEKQWFPIQHCWYRQWQTLNGLIHVVSIPFSCYFDFSLLQSFPFTFMSQALKKWSEAIFHYHNIVAKCMIQFWRLIFLWRNCDVYSTHMSMK